MKQAMCHLQRYILFHRRPQSLIFLTYLAYKKIEQTNYYTLNILHKLYFQLGD